MRSSARRLLLADDPAFRGLTIPANGASSSSLTGPGARRDPREPEGREDDSLAHAFVRLLEPRPARDVASSARVDR